MHEMAKLADGDPRTWDMRLDELSPIAFEGLEILRNILGIVNKLKRIRKVS